MMRFGGRRRTSVVTSGLRNGQIPAGRNTKMHGRIHRDRRGNGAAGGAGDVSRAGQRCANGVGTSLGVIRSGSWGMLLLGGIGGPSPALLPPAAAVVPEDQCIVIGRVFFQGPLAAAEEDFRIAGVGLAEGLDAILLEPAATGDAEAPGLSVLKTIELHQDVDVVRGSGLGHLGDVAEGRAVKVVVPGHVDQKRPLGLAGVALCFSHHCAPFFVFGYWLIYGRLS